MALRKQNFTSSQTRILYYVKTINFITFYLLIFKNNLFAYRPDVLTLNIFNHLFSFIRIKL